MIPDLKKLREQANMTQRDLAERLGIEQSQVSRYEGDPETIGGVLLLKWLDALGRGVHLGDEPPVSTLEVDPGDPYEVLRSRLRLLEDYCGLTGSHEGTGGANQDLPDATQLKSLVTVLGKKPTLAMVGSFDAGKSKTANGMLGQEYLPAQYQPATRLITVVRHISDRPEWIAEEVWIMGPGFDPNSSGDKKHCVANRIVAGNLQTLREYGTYGGRFESTEASAALVFINAPILRGCDIVDLPGFRNDPKQVDEDTKRAESAFAMADAIVYVSRTPGFIDGADLAQLSFLIRRLPNFEAQDETFPTLGNLFVVATHAHPGISDDQMSAVLKGGARRLFEQLEETSLHDRGQAAGRTITAADVRARFFPFWAETASRTRNLRAALSACTSVHLPGAMRTIANRRIAEFRTHANQQIGEQIRAYEAMLADMDAARRSYDEMLAKEPERKAEATKSRTQVERAIHSAATKSASEWSAIYEEVVEVEYLENLIRKRFSGQKGGKNDAKKYAPSYVLELLQGKLGELTKRNSKSVSDTVEDFLGTYTAAAKLPGSDIPFDVRGAFLGGIAGAGVTGALAFWAASLGNLGSYILAAKAVSVLAAMGISISGGTAAAMATIAALGGPITLAVGIFAVAAMLIWGLFGESWESRLAKKLVKEFDSQHMFDKLDGTLATFWKDTEKAFDKAADAVEERFRSRLEELRSLIENPTTSKASIQSALDGARELLGFFANMPWKPV